MNHGREQVRRQREVWVQAERARREQWVADKTKEIKEATVRGLEPDIQRLIARHTQEMRRLEESVREEARRELASEASRAEREIGRLQARRRDLTARSHREISPRDLTARWRVRAPARWPRDGPEMARDEARSACRRLR